jgi:hypothetical protein
MPGLSLIHSPDPDSAKEMMCVKFASSLIVHGESHGPDQHIANKWGQKTLASAAEVVLSCLPWNAHTWNHKESISMGPH